VTSRQASLLEQVLVFYVLLIYSFSVTYSVPFRFEPPLLLLLFQRAAKFIAVLMPLVFFLRQPGVFFRCLTESKTLLFFVVVCLASTLWSARPLITLKEVSLLFLCFSFAGYLACNFSLPNMLFLVLGCNLVGAFCTLVLWWLYPQEAWASTSIGEFGDTLFGLKGSYLHKNFLGFGMNLSILSLLFLYSMRQIWGWLVIPLLVLFGFLLLCSHSATNYVSLLGILGSWGLVRWGAQLNSSKRRGFLSLISLLVFALVIGCLANLPLILTKLNRNETLTGRTQIWGHVWEAIQNRPWLGYGFNSFWPTQAELTQFPEASSIWSKLAWPAFHAHNGYLDLVLSLGILGVFAFGVFLVAHIHNLVRRFLQFNQDEREVTVAGFGLCLWLVVLSINSVESFLLNTRYYALVLLFYLVLLTGSSMRSKKIPMNLFWPKE